MKLRLYHGSKAGLDGAISPERGNAAADFGAGFYLGTDSHQPQTLICGGPSPVLYAAECDFEGLKVFSFEPGLDWALFVAFCRNLLEDFAETSFYRRYREIRDTHDVIFGKIANDRIFNTVQAFFRGEITDAVLTRSLAALNLGDQYCAKTAAACGRIEIVDSRMLTAAECEALGVKAENQRARAIRETKRIRDQYRREGVFFDEILERMAKEGSTCP